MRLIDADELNMIKFHPLPYTHITPSDVNVESYERGWNDAIDAIVECTPTVDVEPVKHGRWYDEPNYLGTCMTMFFCSRCGSASFREDPYCWHCGAKMDGGKDDD